MAKRPRTLADKLRDLDDPTPKDFDPEEDHDSASGTEDGVSDSDDGAENTKGSEHYIDVGKSKLRKPEDLTLGRKYAGAQISRTTLQQDEEDFEGDSAEDEEDDPFGAKRDAVADSQDSQESGDGDEDIDMASDNGEDEKSIEEGDEAESVTDGPTKSENGVPLEGVNKATEERVEEDADEDDEDEDEDEDNDLSSNSDTDTDPSDISDAESSTADQQTLRKMMGESQKSVLASISQATKADAAKGRAVKQQRQTFDALLNTRIRLQKALVAANSLSVATPSAKPSSPSLVSEPDDSPSFQAAEEAAFNLWQTLHNLRSSLIPSSSPSTLKRKRSFTSTTPLATLWTETQALTTSSLPTHRAILDKWARKTRTTTTLPSTSRRLNNTSTDQPLTSIIDSHLSTATLPRLLLKTTVPRSCAPIQAASPHPSSTTNTTDPTTNPLLNPSQVYDDSDLYQSLLTTLVAQRTANLSLANSTATTLLPSTALGLPKLPKQHRLTRTADKKASKGRRVRYDVHDKLQNFMAAEVTGPGWWEESRVGEFFTGLVGGVKRGLREEEEGGEERENDDEDQESDGDGDGEDPERRGGMSGLRLFG